MNVEKDSRADRKAMNKRWGELANKMGTVVEDIVAPCIFPKTAPSLSVPNRALT